MYYGIEASDFDREKDYQASNRRDEKKILFAGAVSPQKGPHVLLDAFAIVARQYPNVRLEFAGPLGNYPLDESFDLSDHKIIKSVAPFYANSALSRIKARLTGKGDQARSFQSYLRERLPQELASKVTFLGNVGIRKQLVDRYYNADVFAFAPIWDEGFGIPPVEAMAAGTPVVGSRSGAMVETLVHGETGLLVDKNDAPALAEALLQLLRDADLREKMGRAARRRALKHFAWETVAAKMLDRYQRLCGIPVDEQAGVAETALS